MIGWVGAGIVVLGLVVGTLLNWSDPPEWLPQSAAIRWTVIGAIVLVLLVLTVLFSPTEGPPAKPAPTNADRRRAGVPEGVQQDDARYLIESYVGIKNVTQGDQRYEAHLLVEPGDFLTVQVFIRNRETSHDVKQLRVALRVPADASPTTSIRSFVSCRRCYSVTDQAGVSSGPPIKLLPVPGSASWRDGPPGKAFHPVDADSLVTSPDGASWGELPADPAADSIAITYQFRVVEATN